MAEFEGFYDEFYSGWVLCRRRRRAANLPTGCWYRRRRGRGAFFEHATAVVAGDDESLGISGGRGMCRWVIAEGGRNYRQEARSWSLDLE